MERQTLKSEIAYAWLRKQILKGELAPGQRLILQPLADSLKMSKMPVREACLRLQREGLVAFESHKGAVVTELSLSELIDKTSVIMWNETLGALESSPRHDAASLSQADLALTAEQDGLDAGEVEQFAQANRRFHAAITARANPATRALVKEMLIATSRGRRAYPNREMMVDVHADHVRILDAFRHGGSADVFRQMEAHRSNYERAWRAVAERGADSVHGQREPEGARSPAAHLGNQPVGPASRAEDRS